MKNWLGLTNEEKVEYLKNWFNEEKMNELDKMVENGDFYELGLRVSNRLHNVGDVLSHNSTQSERDEDEYELDGLCAIKINIAFSDGVDFEDVKTAIDLVVKYFGNHIYLIGNNGACECGNDDGEIIMVEPKIIARIF